MGDARLDLRDLMKLDGQDIHLDRDELRILAQHSADEQTGGQRYQPSRNKQRYLVELTKLRNVRMQEMADQLKRANPSWKKNAIAQAIIESGECANIKNTATVERIIGVARNLRSGKSGLNAVCLTHGFQRLCRPATRSICAQI